MALQTNVTASALTIKYKTGVDANGKDVIKSKKFSNVKITAANQNIYDTAAAFAPLMAYPVSEIQKTDDSTLMNV